MLAHASESPHIRLVVVSIFGFIVRVAVASTQDDLQGGTQIVITCEPKEGAKIDIAVGLVVQSVFLYPSARLDRHRRPTSLQSFHRFLMFSP